MSFGVRLAGKPLQHAHSFKAGTGRVSFLVPRSARGTRLTVALKVVSGGRTATRTVGFRVR